MSSVALCCSPPCPTPRGYRGRWIFRSFKLILLNSPPCPTPRGYRGRWIFRNFKLIPLIFFLPQLLPQFLPQLLGISGPWSAWTAAFGLAHRSFTAGSCFALSGILPHWWTRLPRSRAATTTVFAPCARVTCCVIQASSLGLSNEMPSTTC